MPRRAAAASEPQPMLAPGDGHSALLGCWAEPAPSPAHARGRFTPPSPWGPCPPVLPQPELPGPAVPVLHPETELLARSTSPRARGALGTPGLLHSHAQDSRRAGGCLQRGAGGIPVGCGQERCGEQGGTQRGLSSRGGGAPTSRHQGLVLRPQKVLLAPGSCRHFPLETSSFALSTEVRIPSLPGGYFYWLLAEKWHRKSKKATDVKANIGKEPAEAPPGGNRSHLLWHQAHFKRVLVQFKGFCSLSVLCILRLK